MGIRAKLFLIFFACGLVPLLLLSAINYLTGTRTVEAYLRADVEQNAKGLAENVEQALSEREEGMLDLARAAALRQYVSDAAALSADSARAPAFMADPEVNASAAAGVPESVLVNLLAFFQSNRKFYAAITCLSVNREPLLRLGESPNRTGGYELRFETENFPAGSLALDERVWSMGELKALRSETTLGASDTLVRYTIPVFKGEARTDAPRGALILDLKLASIIKEAASERASSWSNISRAQDASLPPGFIVALRRDGQIVYHTNEAHNHQDFTSVMPSFKNVGQAMKAGQSDTQAYDDANGESWLAAYRPLASLDVSVAAARDESAATRGVRRAGLVSLLLSALTGIVAAVLLAQFASRTARSIERVTEGALAIADGKLDQRIEVRSSDETSLLAETFNRMTDRLREQMIRETEMQQFQAFMRISAMLTHDLKNSISALSLLVNNMERRFDKEEFRRDAMQSLRDATDKLRGLVTKLSNPVETLSGEFKRPRPYDLVPIIRKVLTATAEPVASLHEIETDLPPSLTAVVDAERIEKVVENLVLNAIEAMGTKKGKLSVEAGTEGNGEVFFSVADTGPGMSEEFQRTRLFRPFKTTKSQGVGLGLYTCREVVKALGGHIDVESQKGVGTCFRVVLPSTQKITGPGD